MTASSQDNPILRIQKLWQRCQHLPGGIWLFSRILGWIIPYTGTISANIKIIEPGFAQLQMKEHWRIRNHLHSVHALALANLGEITSGLAMLGTLSGDTRGIPIKISIEYYKKARGLLVAEWHCSPPAVSADTDFEIHTDIRDSNNDMVARTTVNWRLSPVPKL